VNKDALPVRKWKKSGYFKSPNFSNINEIEKNFVNNVLINRPF
jgi:hypothetical protein